MTLCGRVIFLFTILLASVTESLSAEVTRNNPYKIDDRLYKSFMDITNNRVKPNTLERVDSIYREAVRYGDHKAECAIMSIPCQVATIHRDQPMMTKAAERLRELSIKYDYSQYYFFACRQEINLLVEKKMYSVALARIADIETAATRYFKGMGMADIYFQYGYVYHGWGDYAKAYGYYKKALDRERKDSPWQDHSRYYTMLADCQRLMGNGEEALRLTNEGLAEIKDANSLARYYNLMEAKLRALRSLKRDAEADEVYRILVQPRFANLRKMSRNIVLERINHYIYVNQLDSARKAAKMLGDESLAHDWLSLVEQKGGNYKQAYDNIKLSRDLELNQSKDDSNEGLAEFAVLMDKQRLQQQKSALDIENSRLALANTQFDLERQQSAAEMQRIDAENDRLSLQNKNLAYQQLQDANKKYRLEHEVHKQNFEKIETEGKAKMTILTLGAVLFLVIFGLTGLSVLARRRSIKKLNAANQEIEEALEKAEESEHNKIRFLQNMSHEIRTPLNAIVGFSQVLAAQGDEFDDEQKQEFCNIVDQNTELLTTLIDDLLAVSAHEVGGEMITIKPSVCRVNDICEGAMASVTMRCPAGVKLYYTTDVAPDYSITVDGKRMKQVLINFLTNAEKHTTEGEIHMHSSLSENPGRLTVSVTDTGEGVPLDKAEAIFERFEKLNTFVQGTGLGLNICRQVADKMGAEVRLDTTHSGPGARFVMILPIDGETKQ